MKQKRTRAATDASYILFAYFSFLYDSCGLKMHSDLEQNRVIDLLIVNCVWFGKRKNNKQIQVPMNMHTHIYIYIFCSQMLFHQFLCALIFYGARHAHQSETCSNNCISYSVKNIKEMLHFCAIFFAFEIQLFCVSEFFYWQQQKNSNLVENESK